MNVLSFNNSVQIVIDFELPEWVLPVKYRQNPAVIGFTHIFSVTTPSDRVVVLGTILSNSELVWN